MKHLLFAATLLAMLVLPARAADIDGTWTREAQGKGGAQTLTLKAEGMKLTGSMEGGRGGAVQISDGKIDGNKVSFKVVREFNGNTVTQTYEGTVNGKELTLNVEGGFGGGKGKGKGPGGPQVFMKK